MTEPGNSTRTVDSTKAIIKDFGVNVKKTRYMRAAVEARSHFFVRCHEYYIFFGTDFDKKKRAGMGF